MYGPVNTLCELNNMLTLVYVIYVQVNRKDVDGRNWQPKAHSRICSRHFEDGEPTVNHPYPTKELGYNAQEIKGRPPPAARIASQECRVKRQRVCAPDSTGMKSVASVVIILLVTYILAV